MVPSPASRPEVTLPDTSWRTVRHADADYVLRLAWPRGPAPASGYPIVYLLDAHASFATMVEAIRARAPRVDATGVPPTVVAGLSLVRPDDRARRTWDFTPAGLVIPRDEGAGPSPLTGGADALLDFLIRSVLPLVESEHPVDADRRTLFGHSLGGFFALHALFTMPAVFQTWVAASPSIWWDPEGVMRRAASLVSNASGPASRVLLTAGEYEQELAPWQVAPAVSHDVRDRRTRRQMVGRVSELGQRLAPLASRGGVVRTIVFAGEDHASVVPLTINQALRFGPGRIPREA